MHFWWLRYPDRWQLEHKALTDAGWASEVEDTEADRGVIALRVTFCGRASDHAQACPSSEETISGPVLPDGMSLLIRYPAAYPFFPPEVSDPGNTLNLGRHREPQQGLLCLIHTRDWDVRTTAAELLDRQLPRLIAAATTTDATAALLLEDPSPEPVGRYTPASEPLIVVDGAWSIPSGVEQGTLLLGLPGQDGGELGPGVVKLVRGEGLTLDSLADTVGPLFPHNVVGRWIRLADYQPGLEASDLWHLVEPRLSRLKITITATPAEDRPQAAKPEHDLPASAGSADGVLGVLGDEPAPDDEDHKQDPPREGRVVLDDSVQVIGLLVPSEMRYREPGEEWLFLLRSRSDEAPEPVYQLLRSTPGGSEDVSTRTPDTIVCRERRVLIVGVGALGGTIATELARAGIGYLDLVDGDQSEPATACRQLAPVIWAGLPKVLVLKRYLAELNPHTLVGAHKVTVGAAQVTPEGTPDVHTVLLQLVGNADLVIDAAADPTLSRYLAAISRVSDTTFLHASATAGGHGGVVAAIRPDGAACWWCLLHHRHDHTVPYPPAAEPATARVAPAGCGHPTFTGTSADLATIAVHSARVALDRLTASGAASGMRGDLYVAKLRDHHGRPIPVHWHTRTLTRHPACPMHPTQPTQPTQPEPPREPQSTTSARAAPPPRRAATAQPPPLPTVTLAAGHRTTPAPARTLRTQQRKTSTDTGADSGVVPDPNSARQEVNAPWPPATAPTPATARTTSPAPTIS